MKDLLVHQSQLKLRNQQKTTSGLRVTIGTQSYPEQLDKEF
jgi:hypothetical protein